jgi:O-antigen/teichoic acid export membrane protein
MSGYSRLYAINTGVALVLNVGLNLALIPYLGISGAAIAWAVSIATTNLAAVVECRVLLGMRPFGRGYAVAATAALGCFLVIPLAARLVGGTGVPVFVAAVLIGVPAYLLLLHRFRGILDLHVLWSALTPRRPAGQATA